MKGKVSLRFDMPNVSRLRNRLENPSKELTSQLRNQLAVIASKVLNGSQLQIRSEFIAYVDSLGLEFKNAQHKNQVYSVVNSIFDTVFAATPEELAALTGNESDDETDPVEDTDDAPDAAEDAEKEPESSKKKSKAKKATDEFED